MSVRHQRELIVRQQQRHVVVLVLAAAFAASCFLHTCDALPAVPASAAASSSADATVNGKIQTITVDVSKRAEVRLSPLSLVGAFVFGSSNQTADAASGDRSSAETSSSSSSSQEVDKTCAKCSKAEFEEWLRKKVANREEEQRMRIEIIKAQILERLGLSEAPDNEYLISDDFADAFYGEYGTEMAGSSGAQYKDTMRDEEEGMQADAPHHSRRHHYYDTYDTEDAEEELNSVKQIIVRGSKVGSCYSKSPAACISVPLTQKMLNLGRVTSAEMRLHVTMHSNVTADANPKPSSKTRQGKHQQKHLIAMYLAVASKKHVNDTSAHFHSAQFVDTREVTLEGNQPIVFNVAHVLNERLRQALHHRANQIFHGQGAAANQEGEAMVLQFQCKTCVTGQSFDVSVEGKLSPYVIIKVGKQKHRQRRHVIDCQPLSTSCCRDSLYIDFAKIGWKHWILQPSGYYANFCRGECQNLMLPATRHSGIVSQHNVHNPVPRFKPCCAPTKYSPLSLLYYEADGTIMERRIDNLQVESCGCTS